MAAPFSLQLEPAKRLTDQQECALLKQAVAADGASPQLRLRLGQLLNRLDGFAETLALFDADSEPESFGAARVIAAALFARNLPGDMARVAALAEAAERLASANHERASALADSGKALRRMNQGDAAAAALDRALVLDPGHVEALRLRVDLLLEANAPGAVLSLTERLLAAGVCHAGLLSLRARTLVRLGCPAEAGALLGLADFVEVRALTAPAGWPDLSSFNRAVAAELLASHGLREGRHATASVASLRVDDPVMASHPAISALAALIVDAVTTYVAALPSGDHPWLLARPASARLRLWAVITGAAGWEQWHMHPLGWLSGGYYAAVPDAVVVGDGPAGCLELGLPVRLRGEAAVADPPPQLIRPHPGLLTMFPSHAYHRTYAHEIDAQRICIAFDVMPD